MSVSNTNLPPNAEDDVVSTPYDTPVTVPVLENDVDPNGDELIVTDVTQGLHGKCSITENNEVLYEPDSGHVGPDLCPYVVCDSSNECDTANVFIEVEPGPPMVNDDTVQTPPETPVLKDVLDNDTHPQALPLEVTDIATQPENGVCDVIDGQVQYTPNQGFIGTDSCDYVACVEGTTTECDEGTVTVDVVPSQPIANDDTSQTLPGTPILTDVLDNDTHPQDLPLEITDITTQPDNGTCVVIGDQIQYTPNADFVGSDSCEYTACVEGSEVCDTAELVVDVVQPAPQANDDKERTPINTPVVSNVAENDLNPSTSDKPLEVTAISTQPENGVCEVIGGQVQYTPDQDFVGTNQCEYTICVEGTPSCDTAKLVVDVVEVKLAEDDQTETPQDTPIMIDVLENDSNPDDPEQSLVVVDVTQPENGLCEVTDNQVQYVPAAGFSGTDGCIYTVCLEDKIEVCDEGTVNVNVIPKVVVEDDQAETPPSTPVLVDVLDNDEPQGPLVIIDTTQPENGECKVVENQVQFTPNQDFGGTDTCDYTACIEGSPTSCDKGTVIVDVVPSMPIAVDDQTETPPETAVSVDVLENDTHPQNRPLEVTGIATPPENGVCEVIEGQVQYTPNEGFIGSDSCDYILCVRVRRERCGIRCNIQAAIAEYTLSNMETKAGTTECDEGTVNVNVVPSKPVAEDDNVQTPPETPVLKDVLDNDTHPQALPLEVTDIATQPENGVCDVIDGQVQYTPNQGFIGTDSCDYVACVEGTTTECDEGTVTVDVVPSQPIANDDTSQTLPGTPILTDVLDNDTHPQDLPLEITDITTQPDNGTCVVIGDQIQYTPNADFVGSDSCEYTVCVEGSEVCDAAELVVDVINAPTVEPTPKPTMGNVNPVALGKSHESS